MIAVAPLIESLSTLSTLIWLFVRMDYAMIPPIPFIVKSFVTNIAFIMGDLLMPPSYVSDEIIFPHVHSITLIAMVWFIDIVFHFHVV